MENTYTLAVYIPGVTYKSKGPGFVDAIKLTATDHNNPEQKYDIYTEYKTKKSNNIVYRTTARPTANLTPDVSAFKVQNFTDTNRSAYGKFYDYLDEMSEDGTIGHTLTCFSDVDTAKQMQSHNQKTKDGLFIIVVNEADALIDLKFEFYTLSANAYDRTETTLENDYILIGEKTSQIRPSTYGDEASIDMISEDALTLYYDITEKDADIPPTVHLPISEDTNALKVLQEQEDGGKVNILTNGDDAFAEYTEKSTNKTDVFKEDAPIIIDVSTSKENSIISTDAQATLAMYVGQNTLESDGMGSHNNEWFTCPTKVNVGPRQTMTSHIKISFSLMDVALENTNILWGKQPTFAVKNYIYENDYKPISLGYTYSPISILEYMPSLTSIDVMSPVGKESEQPDIDLFKLSGWNTMPSSNQHATESTGKTRDYTANINNAGKYFSAILQNLPYTTYSIKSYMNNLGWSGRDKKNVQYCFIDRPQYVKDLVSVENGMTSSAYIDSLKDESTHYCNLSIQDNITIMSDTSKNKIHDNKTWSGNDENWSAQNVYPLVSLKNPFGDSYSEKTIRPVLFPYICWFGDGEDDPKPNFYSESAVVNPIAYTIDKTVYQHIFTEKDTEALPCILGKNPIFIVGKSTLDLDNITTDCHSPVLNFTNTWGMRHIYEKFTFDDPSNPTKQIIDPYTSHKCPAHKAFTANHYQDIVNWAREQTLQDGRQTKVGEKFVGEYPFKTGNRYYEQKIVLSPMIGIDYNKSKMTFSNTGDYEIIPAYYYGDATTENGVSTDIKGQKTNVELVFKDCITEQYITKPSANKIAPITSSFSNRTMAPVAVDNNEDGQVDQQGTQKDILTLYNNTKLNNIQTGYIHFYNVELEPGLYVFKFQPYVDASSGIEFLNLNNSNALSCELYYTYNEDENPPKLTLYGNFIVIYVKNTYNGDLGFLLKSKQENETIRVSNFGLFKVQMEDPTNVNQVLLKWWYDTASMFNDFKNASKPILISDAYPEGTDAYKFVHTLYDNIIFPSAICAYDNFTLFAKTDGTQVDGYTKHYKSLYFPENPIYNIVGKYNISDMTITHIDFDKRYVDDAFTMEDAICYNQISRQYHG